MAPNAADAERLAEDTGLRHCVTGLSREEFAAARRACGRLNYQRICGAQAAGLKTAVQYGYWRGEDGRMYLAATTVAVTQLRKRVREIDRWAIARRNRKRAACAGAAPRLGRAPRAATNARRSGSRRAASRASSRGGDSGDSDGSEPPGLAARRSALGAAQ